MADYKEILSGTVETLVSRAKDLAGSDVVAGAVGKVREAAVNTGVFEVYEKGARRAKSFTDATRLTVDLNRDYKELERVYTEIGKLYYDQAKDAPDGFFPSLFSQVSALRSAIAEKEGQIEAYKANFSPSAEASDSAVDVDRMNSDIADFEEIVNRTETDGTSV